MSLMEMKALLLANPENTNGFCLYCCKTLSVGTILQSNMLLKTLSIHETKETTKFNEFCEKFIKFTSLNFAKQIFVFVKKKNHQMSRVRSIALYFYNTIIFKRIDRLDNK